MHVDRKVVGVLLVSSVCLVLIEVGAKNRLNLSVFGRSDSQFLVLMRWVAWCVISYGVLPATYVMFVLREDLSDYGLQLGKVWQFAWAYLLMLAVVVPLAFVMSARASFQDCYPFFRAAVDHPLEFWIWQLGYALQFVCLEFFFRGFMVHGLEPKLGWYGVLVMTVPYCLIHLGKPLPEVFASIIAGLVLGFLALQSRSIFWGAAAHISVAVSMDMFCLWRGGRLLDVFKLG